MEKRGAQLAAFPPKKRSEEETERKTGPVFQSSSQILFQHLPPFFHREYTTTSRRSAMHKHCRNLGNTEATNLVHDCLHTESACMRIFTRRGYVHTYPGSVLWGQSGERRRVTGLGGGGKKDETKERRGGTVACGKNKRNNDRTCRSPDFTMQRYRTNAARWKRLESASFPVIR